MILFAVQKTEHKVNFERLKAEYVDMKKEPVITVVRGSQDTPNNYQPLGATHEDGDR